MTSVLKQSSRIWCWGLALAFVAVSAAEGSEIRFSPSPAVAGQPITVTFTSLALACEDEGLLEFHQTIGNRIDLLVTPPNCPILPPGFVEYTASTTIGPLAAGTYFVSVFGSDAAGSGLREIKELVVKSPPVCQATATSLCLADGRFRVTGTFRPRRLIARAVPDGFDGLGDWGLLWFFSQDNPEILIKILDTCATNGHYSVFISPASILRHDVTVRDVRTGVTKTYANPQSGGPRLITDTTSFSCS
jgi:hypothetical protein